MTENLNTEQFCLKLSVIFNILCAFSCAIVGIHENSGAVIFDAFYCFLLSIGSFLLIVMSKKVYAPPSSSFQYGYDKFEPLMVFLQSAVIVISCFYAALSSFRDLIHPNEINNFALVAILQFVLFILSTVMFALCKWYAKKLKNRILKVQSLSWWTDSLQSLVLCLAFTVGFYSRSWGLGWLAPYVDPIALIFLVVSIIREPAHFLRVSLIELLDGIHPGEDIFKIESSVRAFFAKRNLELNSFRFRKAGKKIYIGIGYQPRADVNLEQLAKLQKELNEYLKTTLFNYSFDAFLIVDEVGVEE